MKRGFVLIEMMVILVIVVQIIGGSPVSDYETGLQQIKEEPKISWFNFGLNELENKENRVKTTEDELKVNNDEEYPRFHRKTRGYHNHFHHHHDHSDFDPDYGHFYGFDHDQSFHHHSPHCDRHHRRRRPRPPTSSPCPPSTTPIIDPRISTATSFANLGISTTPVPAIDIRLGRDISAISNNGDAIVFPED